MNEAPTRRAVDQGFAAIAGRTAKETGSGFWNWGEKRHIPAHIVIATTIWLTWDIVQWAMWFADLHVERDSNTVGVILGAVLTPWGLMQAAMFKFYSESIRNGGSNGNAQDGIASRQTAGLS